MSIATYLTALDRDRDALAANLTTKGVPASSSETFTTLVPKVLDIPSGGGGSIPLTNATLAGVNSNNIGTFQNATLFASALKEISFEDITLAYNSAQASFSYGFYSWGGNLEKISIKNCTINNTYSGGGMPVAFQGSVLTSLKKVILENCTAPISNQVCRNSVAEEITFKDVINLNGMTQSMDMFCYNNSRLKKFEFYYTNASNYMTAKNTGSMFGNCTSLEYLDISGIDFTSCTSYTGMFNNVPTTCTIYVRDAANQAWLSSHFGTYTFTIKS